MPDLSQRLVERNFRVADGALHIGGVSVRELEARFGTPLFVYDRSLLRRQLESLRACLPAGFEVFYSVKANPNQSVLKFFVESGAGLEIASAGEFYQAERAGAPPSRILFAGPGKTEAELRYVLERGIGELHVESLREIELVARIAGELRKTAHIAIRINPATDVQGGAMRMGGKPAAFGIEEEQLEVAVAAVHRQPELELSGLHLFTGTQILDANLLLAQYERGIELAARTSASTGKPLHTIDFGGGLGIPYFGNDSPLELAPLREGLARLAISLRANPLLRDTRCVLEPGRFLVGEAGVYLVKILDVKTSRGKTFYICDGGMHHHLAASGNLGQTIKRNFPMVLATRMQQEPAGAYDVVGPLCTPLDTIGRAVQLPAAQPGDLLAILQSGAYALTASPMRFLSHPDPAEVMVADGVPQLVRQRGRFEDFLRDQPALAAQRV